MFLHNLNSKLKLSVNTLCILMFVCVENSLAQNTNDTTTLYTVNRLSSSLMVGVGFTTNALGLKILDNRSKVTTKDLTTLNSNDVPRFERWVLNQNSEQFTYWHNQSDVIMRTSLILPAVFLAHKRIRKQWLDYSLMYLKAQALSANFYTLGVPQFYRKIRPVVYYDNLSLQERTGVRLSNSFYSGHVSVTATSMYFMASVYHDLYPERSQILPLSIASLTTGLVAIGRVKAGKHFVTDVLTGAIIGGLIGYFTPHFHSKKKDKTLSVDVGYLSFNMSLKF